MTSPRAERRAADAVADQFRGRPSAPGEPTEEHPASDGSDHPASTSPPPGEIPVRELLSELISEIGRPPRDDRYSTSVAGWVARYLSAGRPIRHLLALPPAWQSPVLTAVCGLGDYGGSNPGLVVRLRNRSGKPIRVQVGSRSIPAPPTAGADGIMIEGAGIGRVKPLSASLSSGQEIELTAIWAIPALRRHCGSIYPLAVRETSSSVPRTDRLEEVSYETRLSVSIDDDTDQRPARRP